MFAYRTNRMATMLAGGGKMTIVDTGVIEAKTIEEARDHIVSRSSIAAIKDGLTIEIVPVSFDGAKTYHSQYNGDPWKKKTVVVTVDV